MTYTWSLWIDMVVGMAAAVVVVPVVFYLVQWSAAQALRAIGLSRWQTLRVLWDRLEAELIRRLNRWAERLNPPTEEE